MCIYACLCVCCPVQCSGYVKSDKDRHTHTYRELHHVIFDIGNIYGTYVHAAWSLSYY